ncbi:MAG: hypothetical protein V4519_03955 [Patescibacteria group bacterium]
MLGKRSSIFSILSGPVQSSMNYTQDDPASGGGPGGSMSNNVTEGDGTGAHGQQQGGADGGNDQSQQGQPRDQLDPADRGVGANDSDSGTTAVVENEKGAGGQTDV